MYNVSMVKDNILNNSPESPDNKENKENMAGSKSPSNSASKEPKAPAFKSFNKNGSKFPVKYAVAGICLAAVLALGLTYLFGTSGSKGITSPRSGEASKEELRLQNPITGVMYTKDTAGPINERPLAVMVNNHVDARPQSGLTSADVIYEIVAEGGITRFIAFYMSETPKKIGPIRSTRDYYLVLVKELGDAMVMHIGWSPQALEAIETWPVRSLGRGGAEFWRDNPRNVATEHTAYADGEYLRKLGKELGWEGRGKFAEWQFKEDSPVATPDTSEIAIDFWSKGDYSGIFHYDTGINSYLRFTGYDSNDAPIPLKDQETNEQVKVKTVIVQFADETSVPGDEKNRLSYQLVGSGTGLVFTDGTVTEVTWSKEDRDARTMFYTTDGEEMVFNRGKLWISIVPSRNVLQVIY